MSIEFLDSDFDKVSYLASLIKTSVTGGDIKDPRDNAEFKTLRLELLKDDFLVQYLPSWLKITRDLSGVWDHIQPRFPSYRERRIFIDEEFSEVLSYLELGTKDSSIDLLNKKMRSTFSPIKHSDQELKPSMNIQEIQKTSNKVFIVHGRDNEVKQEVARFIDSVGLEAIILHEQANRGMTIIDKIDHYSNDVGFALVLYTPCDLGKSVSEHQNGILAKKRARQNVVFEHGYLMAKLGKDKVAALVKDDDIEKPNDIAGVVYISLDKAGAWKLDVMKELKCAGYKVK